MLVQLLKETFLLLFWRELIPDKNSGCKISFKPKQRPGFELLLLTATWALAFFLLSVSVPHSIEVIHRYEKGSEQFRQIKSVLLAITIEIIAALVLLIGLHTRKLDRWQRRTLFALATPFVMLTLHLQFVYYAGLEVWLVYPWELAAVLPGGVLVCAVVVAFLWPILSSQQEQIQPSQVVTTTAATLPQAANAAIEGIKTQIEQLEQTLIEIAAAVRLTQPEVEQPEPSPQVSVSIPTPTPFALPKTRYIANHSTSAADGGGNDDFQLLKPPLSPQTYPQAQASGVSLTPFLENQMLMDAPLAAPSFLQPQKRNQPQSDAATPPLQSRLTISEQLQKEEEALQLYEELGTYAAVAQRMGFKSERTASNLVKRALARRTNARTIAGS